MSVFKWISFQFFSKYSKLFKKLFYKLGAKQCLEVVEKESNLKEIYGRKIATDPLLLSWNDPKNKIWKNDS